MSQEEEHKKEYEEEYEEDEKEDEYDQGKLEFFEKALKNNMIILESPNFRISIPYTTNRDKINESMQIICKMERDIDKDIKQVKISVSIPK